MYYYGAKLKCDMTQFGKPCEHYECGICGISKNGMRRPETVGRSTDKRFGEAFYFSPSPAKCHEYTEEFQFRRGILLLDILPGKKFKFKDGQHLTSIPDGYDSMYGKPRNFEVLSLKESVRARPRYLITYVLK